MNVISTMDILFPYDSIVVLWEGTKKVWEGYFWIMPGEYLRKQIDTFWIGKREFVNIRIKGE